MPPEHWPGVVVVEGEEIAKYQLDPMYRKKVKTAPLPLIMDELSAFAMEGPEAEQLQDLIAESIRRDVAAAEKHIRRQNPPEKSP